MHAQKEREGVDVALLQLKVSSESLQILGSLPCSCREVRQVPMSESRILSISPDIESCGSASVSGECVPHHMHDLAKTEQNHHEKESERVEPK